MSIEGIESQSGDGGMAYAPSSEVEDSHANDGGASFDMSEAPGEHVDGAQPEHHETGIDRTAQAHFDGPSSDSHAEHADGGSRASAGRAARGGGAERGEGHSHAEDASGRKGARSGRGAGGAGGAHHSHGAGGGQDSGTRHGGRKHGADKEGENHIDDGDGRAGRAQRSGEHEDQGNETSVSAT